MRSRLTYTKSPRTVAVRAEVGEEIKIIKKTVRSLRQTHLEMGNYFYNTTLTHSLIVVGWWGHSKGIELN